MCAVLWLTIRQYGEFFLFPHYIPLNLFSKFNENDKLLSECGICPSYIRRIMARSSHTPDTAGTGNDGRQIPCTTEDGFVFFQAPKKTGIPADCMIALSGVLE